MGRRGDVGKKKGVMPGRMTEAGVSMLRGWPCGAAFADVVFTILFKKIIEIFDFSQHKGVVEG